MQSCTCRRKACEWYDSIEKVKIRSQGGFKSGWSVYLARYKGEMLSVSKLQERQHLRSLAVTPLATHHQGRTRKCQYQVCRSIGSNKLRRKTPIKRLRVEFDRFLNTTNTCNCMSKDPQAFVWDATPSIGLPILLRTRVLNSLLLNFVLTSIMTLHAMRCFLKRLPSYTSTPFPLA